MKVIQKMTMVGALGSAFAISVNAQTPPYLSISNNSSTAVQLNWTNQVGTSYRILSTSSLAIPRSLWTPLEDAFSSDSNLFVSLSRGSSPVGFYTVEIPTNSGVQIFSPTNNQTISGTIAIGVGAQIGSQLQGVNLYLDGALVSYLNSGGVEFDLDTTHFSNGLHTVYVGADDTGNNETPSSTITLDFENSVRWLNAVSLFQSVVPINVQSDIFPANWTVFVADGNGTVVRTFSGTTSNGSIATSWDGNDNNGVSVPSQAGYTITVAVTPSGSGSSSMMSSPSLATSSDPFVVSASPNRYGVMEYQVQEPMPDPMVTYSNLLQSYLNTPEDEKIIFPPFWELPVNEPVAPEIITISAYDMFMLQHPAMNATSNGSMDALADEMSTDGDPSTSTTVWRESYWTSGETILAYAGDLGFPQNGYVSSDMSQISVMIDDLNYGSRGTFKEQIYPLTSSSDFSTLINNLAQTSPDNARAFYFYGHGNTNGNAIGTLTVGITAGQVAAALSNYSTNSNQGKQLLSANHPNSFVFLDGCNTGLGDFPTAFGISKTITGDQITAAGLHKRAFMGWGAPVTHSILFNTPLQWSFKFWTTWLNNGNGSSTTLLQAVASAEATYSGISNQFNLKIYGNKDLRWSD